MRGGEVREIIGAVDETFLERMMLVFMDLLTGYLLLEEVADDRTYATWKALVDERLKALGTRVRYVVSDRAKALIQLAEQGFECLSMPDFFHCIHELVKSYSFAIGSAFASSPTGAAHKPKRLAHARHPTPEGQHHARRYSVRERAASAAGRGYTVPIAITWRSSPSRCILFTSTILSPQTSAQVQNPVARQRSPAIETLAQEPSVPGASRRHEEGAQAVACPGCSRGFLVGRASGRTWSRRLSPCHGDRWASECPAALGLLGTPHGPHTLRAEESPDTAGMGGGAHRVSPRMSLLCDCLRRPWRLAHVGHAAGSCLSTHLLGSGRPQRCSCATPSQSAGITAAAVQGVDGLA